MHKGVLNASSQWDAYPIPVLREARNVCAGMIQHMDEGMKHEPSTYQWAINTWRELNTHIAIRVEREGDWLRWSRSPEYEVWETWHLNNLDA